MQALTQVQPRELDASEIEIRIGATWIDPKYINDFMRDIFQTPEHLFRRDTIGVQFSGVTGEWNVKGKNADYGNTLVNMTYGTSRVNAYKILEDSLNLKDTRVYDTIEEDGKLFAKVRSGQVRFLLGSTAKMGAGTNVQDRLIALHHLDVPWRPSDIEQQEGRILRQGNQNDKVKIFRYVTEGMFDSYSWQLIENKQKFIGQIVTSKSPVRSCEDVDEAALSYEPSDGSRH